MKFVKRPAGVKPNSTATVYAMVDDSSTARPKQIRFGRLAGQNIEVLDGLEVGERLIVSDLSNVKLDGGSLTVQSR